MTSDCLCPDCYVGRHIIQGDIPSPISRPSTPTPGSPFSMDLMNSPLLLPPPALTRSLTDPGSETHSDITLHVFAQVTAAEKLQRLYFNAVVTELNDLFANIIHFNILLGLIPYHPQLVSPTQQQELYETHKICAAPSVMQNMSENRSLVRARHPGLIIRQRITNSFHDLLIELNIYMNEHRDLHDLIIHRNAWTMDGAYRAPSALLIMISTLILDVHWTMLNSELVD